MSETIQLDERNKNFKEMINWCRRSAGQCQCDGQKPFLAVCLVLCGPDGSYLIRRRQTNKDKVKSEVRAAGGCELLNKGCLGVETRVTMFRNLCKLESKFWSSLLLLLLPLLLMDSASHLVQSPSRIRYLVSNRSVNRRLDSNYLLLIASPLLHVAANGSFCPSIAGLVLRFPPLMQRYRRPPPGSAALKGDMIITATRPISLPCRVPNGA